MRQQARGGQQQSHVDGVKAIARYFVVRAIGAVRGGHEVRIVEEQGQQVKRERPLRGLASRHQRGYQQQGSRPGAAAYQQIQRRRVNPDARAGA